MLAVGALEQVSGKDLGALVADLVAGPLGLESLELAQTPAQFSKLYWSEARKYCPKWVYHGCLIGTVPDAARLLHVVFQGGFLRPETLETMLEYQPLGGAIAGRLWVKCGYGLGLMVGQVGGGMRAIGHSGAGWFSVNSVCHFPDQDEPVTVACFTSGVAEFGAVRIATAPMP